MATDKRRERELGEIAGGVVRVAYEVIGENLKRGQNAAAAIARGEFPKLDEQNATHSSKRAAKDVRRLGEATENFVEAVILAASRFGTGFMDKVDPRWLDAPPRSSMDRAAALFLESAAQVVAPATATLKHRHGAAPTSEGGTLGPLELKKKESGEKQESKAPGRPTEFLGKFRVQNVTGLNARFEFRSNGLLGPRGSRIPAEAVKFATRPNGDGGRSEWKPALSVYIPAGQSATLEIRISPDYETAAGVYDGLIIGESPTLGNHLPPRKDGEPSRDGAARAHRVSRAIQLTIETAAQAAKQRVAKEKAAEKTEKRKKSAKRKVTRKKAARAKAATAKRRRSSVRWNGPVANA